MKLPKQLKIQPLLDAVFELRFEPGNAATGELLPGLLFEKLGNSYPQVEALPMASVPREIREKDPNLHYKAYYRMVGKNRRLDMGQRVVDLGFGAPYPGWKSMRSTITQLLNALLETKLIKLPQRFSLRYINIIPTTNEQQLSALNARIDLLGKPASERGFRLRTELIHDKYRTIIQIQTNATAVPRNGEKRTGLLVDVDTIRPVGTDENFWKNKESLLDEAHQMLKETFFSLLMQETIESLKPEWEEE